MKITNIPFYKRPHAADGPRYRWADSDEVDSPEKPDSNNRFKMNFNGLKCQRNHSD